VRRAAFTGGRKTPNTSGCADPASPPNGSAAECLAADRIVFVDQIPKTSVGKIDKKVLRART
jgi:acyl-CoA synthetase (AMP-forming)/AMP-acid ligase II